MRLLPWTALAAIALGGCNLLHQWRPEPPNGYATIFAEASSGDVAAVSRAIDRDPRLVRAHEQDGLTLLHDAAAEGRVDMADMLVRRGARLEARTGGGLTPLHLAAQNGDLPMARLLLRRGAKVNAKDRGGRTPLDQAVLRGHADTAHLLRAEGGRSGRAR